MTNRHDRYLALVEWAKRRYTRADGSYIARVGNGIAGLPSAPSTTFQRGNAYTVPSRYTLIEDMAAARYLGIAPRLTNWTLASCYGG